MEPAILSSDSITSKLLTDNIQFPRCLHKQARDVWVLSTTGQLFSIVVCRRHECQMRDGDILSAIVHLKQIKMEDSCNSEA